MTQLSIQLEGSAARYPRKPSTGREAGRLTEQLADHSSVGLCPRGGG